MNKTSTAIVIQGPSSYVEELKQAWTGFNLIWSTWCGNESNYLDTDTVVFNNLPQKAGIKNLAYQTVSTLGGLKKAKELGYSHVLKWRSDMLPTNSKKLLELFDENALNFLGWHSEGYFVDYFMYGPTEQLLLAWDLDTNAGPFPEKVLITNLQQKQLTKFHCIVHKLSTEVDIRWIKYGINLAAYQQYDCYKNELNAVSHADIPNN